MSHKLAKKLRKESKRILAKEIRELKSQARNWIISIKKLPLRERLKIVGRILFERQRREKNDEKMPISR